MGEEHKLWHHLQFHSQDNANHADFPCSSALRLS